jgi:hypothetical protein
MSDRPASATDGLIVVRISAAELLAHGGGNAAFVWAAEKASRQAAEAGRAIITSIHAVGTARDPADDSVTITFPLQPTPPASRPAVAAHGSALQRLMAKQAEGPSE